MKRIRAYSCGRLWQSFYIEATHWSCSGLHQGSCSAQSKTVSFTLSQRKAPLLSTHTRVKIYILQLQHLCIEGLNCKQLFLFMLAQVVSCGGLWAAAEAFTYLWHPFLSKESRTQFFLLEIIIKNRHDTQWEMLNLGIFTAALFGSSFLNPNCCILNKL